MLGFLLFSVLFCTSYANENKYIFIGQNDYEGGKKTAFILEVLEEDLENIVQINGEGEISLKVDGIISMPKDTFSRIISLNAFENSYEDKEIRCKNKNCRYFYCPRPGYRNCPRCGTPN